MHDIDSTARELVDELLISEQEGLDPEAAELEGYDEVGGLDSETDLAAELLEITDEAELDHFLGKLAKSAGRFFKSPVGKMLKGALKGVAGKALPLVGSALGNLVLPGVGGAIGGKLAGALGSGLGLEAEAMSDEELQMEVAKGVVRTAKQAIRYAAQDPRASASPRLVVRDAVSRAVGKNLPGLLRPATSRPVATRRHGGGRVSGRWERRGDQIILFGV